MKKNAGIGHRLISFSQCWKRDSEQKNKEYSAQHAMVWIVELHLWCYLKTENPGPQELDWCHIMLSFVFCRTQGKRTSSGSIRVSEDLSLCYLRVSLDSGPLRVTPANSSVSYSITFLFKYFPSLLNRLVNITASSQLCPRACPTFSEEQQEFSKVGSRSNGDSHLYKPVVPSGAASSWGDR